MMPPMVLNNVAVEYAPINISGALGDYTVLAAEAGTRYRILHYNLIQEAFQALTFKSGSNNLSGAMLNVTFSSTTPFISPLHDQAPWGVMQTNKGEAFIINKSDAFWIRGYITFQRIRDQPQQV